MADDNPVAAESPEDQLWRRSRSGAHAGRGFRYQDAVAAEVAVRGLTGDIRVRKIVPEGLEDVSIELDTHWLHLQAKSRRDYRGEFAPADVAAAWAHLAERLSVDPSAHAGLVLERPLRGQEATGLDRTLVGASRELRAAITAAVKGQCDPNDFLGRAHLIVAPAPAQSTVDRLAELLKRSPATCVALEAVIRKELAGAADENGVRHAGDPAALSMSDIARLIDDLNEAIDPSALEQAVREGIAEVVDFATPIGDENFFAGVDVVVGHVVAGLPVDRPEASMLEEAVLDKGLAIAVGPSGSGKSALIWLVAYATRHDIRWYRMRRLLDTDVPPLVRLVKALRPTGARVGFVVDDLGRSPHAGFDLLAEELRHHPRAVLLGASREEDLIMVASANRADKIRLILSEPLAERIHRELRARGQTALPGWREAFEASDGLLLEYGHLLTEGTRLVETIASQVQRRLRERRAAEIEVLALVSTTDAFGAELALADLERVLAIDRADLRTALARLIAEHLIHEHEGMLGGLHELRSRYLMDEVHRVPPPILQETVDRVVRLVPEEGLQPFLTRLLLQDVIEDEFVSESLVQRISDDPNPRALSGALQAFRLVSIRRAASQWVDACLAEGVGATHVQLVATFAQLDSEIDVLPETVQRAIQRVREIEAVDLRAPLLERISGGVRESIARANDVSSVAAMLASLGEVGQAISFDANELTALAVGKPLHENRLLLEAAYAVAPALATACAEALGGPEAMVDRIGRELPWIRNSRLTFDEEGRQAAEAEYAYVAESFQPPAHDAVVELCRYLIGLIPTAEVAVSRAIDATGGKAGFGMALADKRIDRRNLPSQAQVAWNRARVRAAIAAVAAPSETDHLEGARDVLRLAARLVARFSDAWVRGQRPTQSMLDEAIKLRDLSNNLRPAPIAIEAVGPLEEGDLPGTDAVPFVGNMIASNLFPGLFQGNPVAPVIPQILEQLQRVSSPDVWRLLDRPPLRDIAQLTRMLTDLHAVLAEASADRASMVATRSAGRHGLPAAASAARRRARDRMQGTADQLARDLDAHGFRAHVLLAEQPPDAYRWPSDDVLVLVDIPTVCHWQAGLEALMAVCKPVLRDRIGFLMAPLREGKVVASQGAKVIDHAFPDDSVKAWPSLPFPVLAEALGDLVREGLEALREASGILADQGGRALHEEEEIALGHAWSRARAAGDRLRAFAHGDSDLAVEVSMMYDDLVRQVESETPTNASGDPIDGGLAAAFIAGLNGEHNELFAAQIGMLTYCAEWDVNPEGAWERVEQALYEIDRSGPGQTPED